MSLADLTCDVLFRRQIRQGAIETVAAIVNRFPLHLLLIPAPSIHRNRLERSAERTAEPIVRALSYRAGVWVTSLVVSVRNGGPHRLGHATGEADRS